MFGPSGSGKTVLSRGLVEQLDVTCVYVHGAELWSRSVLHISLCQFKMNTNAYFTVSCLPLIE